MCRIIKVKSKFQKEKVSKQVHGRAGTGKGGGKKRNPQVSLFFSTQGGRQKKNKKENVKTFPLKD